MCPFIYFYILLIHLHWLCACFVVDVVVANTFMPLRVLIELTASNILGLTLPFLRFKQRIHECVWVCLRASDECVEFEWILFAGSCYQCATCKIVSATILRRTNEKNDYSKYAEDVVYFRFFIYSFGRCYLLSIALGVNHIVSHRTKGKRKQIKTHQARGHSHTSYRCAVCAHAEHSRQTTTTTTTTTVERNNMGIAMLLNTMREHAAA